MPELPEVETVRRDLEQDVQGKRVSFIEVRDPRVIKEPSAPLFARRLKGAGLSRFLRRAKVLIVGLSNGGYLVVHLRMTGQLVHSKNPDKKACVIFGLSDGSYLNFNDQRRFGELRLVKDWRELKFIKALGPEPLDKEFSLPMFKKMLSGKKTKIKPLLMDQAFIAGIGNLYAQEALFHAGVRPDRPACSLREKEAAELYKAIKKVLRGGIRHRGSSIENYVTGRGQRGAYHLHLRVYERKGENCFKCKRPILKDRIGGRGTCFCARCQK